MAVERTMMAARVHRVRSAEESEVFMVEEAPVPSIGSDEVLVKVGACGVCASDLHVLDGTTPPGTLPMILGHEAAGTVAATGPDSKWKVGARVSILMSRYCGVCVACREGRQSLCKSSTTPGVDSDGSFADYTMVRSDHLVRVPNGVPIETAAILTDAVATPYHALKRAELLPGMTCVVVGLGGLGMHAVKLAKTRGASVIGVDVDQWNLKRALDWGADHVIDASALKPARVVRELTGGGADRSFEFVGSAATQSQAVKCLRAGGRAVIVGLSREELAFLSTALFVAQELEVVGSFGSSPTDLEELMEMVASGDLDLSDSITHRWALADVSEAMTALATRENHPIRMVVLFDE